MRINQYLIAGLALATLPLAAQAYNYNYTYTEYVDLYDTGVYETSTGSYIVSENCRVKARNSKVTIRGDWMTFKNGKKCYIDDEYENEVELHVEYYYEDRDEAEENYSDD